MTRSSAALVFSGLLAISVKLSNGQVSAVSASGSPFELQIHRAAGATTGSSAPCSLISLHETQIHKDLIGKDASTVVSSSHRFFNGDGAHALDDMFEQYFSFDAHALWDIATTECGSFSSTTPQFGPMVPLSDLQAPYVDDDQVLLSEPESWGSLPPPPELEVFPLITSGNSSNRIDFVFFGDGYTKDEKVKFLRDAQMLADDLAYNETFTSVKPLMNFWAAFTPSNESGVGIGGKPNDTPFGLYRDGTELRAVYYAKPKVAHSACLSLGVQCDFPILLGNDPLYGGLGGRFTVVTASEANGALVLRHELGHSVIKEGEEYDGGYAYYGPNAANLTQGFKWQHWLSNSSSSNPPRAERSVMPLQAYAWTMLNSTEPWKTGFESSGIYARHLVRFSLSGIPNENDLSVHLDGQDLHWTPKIGIGMDRWHYDIYINRSLSEGDHEVLFDLRNKGLEGNAQLCSVEILEFGKPDEFDATEGFIGAFPTYSETNITTYRPTNEGCLMRIVTAQSFCKVCIEGLWHALLRRVNLIDSYSTRCELLEDGSPKRIISLDLLHLGQLRDGHVGLADAYILDWTRNGEPLRYLRNFTEVAVDSGKATYGVTVKYVTEEVRTDPHGYLQASMEFEVSDCLKG